MNMVLNKVFQYRAAHACYSVLAHLSFEHTRSFLRMGTLAHTFRLSTRGIIAAHRHRENRGRHTERLCITHNGLCQLLHRTT